MIVKTYKWCCHERGEAFKKCGLLNSNAPFNFYGIWRIEWTILVSDCDLSHSLALQVSVGIFSYILIWRCLHVHVLLLIYLCIYCFGYAFLRFTSLIIPLYVSVIAVCVFLHLVLNECYTKVIKIHYPESVYLGLGISFLFPVLFF